jgi:hypothetical protein
MHHLPRFIRLIMHHLPRFIRLIMHHLPRFIRLIMHHASLLFNGSHPVVGSSNTSKEGAPMVLMARLNRR